jgi:hypothetical protein
VIIQAQPGADTFSAFSIPILQKLDDSNAQCQALILVPTYELSLKIHNVVAAQGKYMGIQSQGCSGAAGIEEFTLRSSESRIVVETPGSVLNQIKSGNLKIGFVKMIFVYEVDEMISNGFGGPIHDVFQRLRPGTQAVFLSTKVPRETMGIITKKIADKFMREPIRIVVGKDTGAEWYEAFLRIHGVETEGTEAGDSVQPVANVHSPGNGHGQGIEAGDRVPPMGNVQSPSNRVETEGTEAGDSVPPVENVHSPGNGCGKEGMEAVDRGRGKRKEAGHNVPPVGKVHHLTHDNLLQHQLRYGNHKLGKETKHLSTVTCRPYRSCRKGHAKKNELTPNHSKTPCPPLPSNSWSKQDEAVHNQHEIDHNQVEKDTGAKWYEEFLHIHGIGTEGIEAGDSAQPVANVHSPSNDREQEGAESGDSAQHVANVHSPSNGHGQGIEAGDSVPPVANVHSPGNGGGKEGAEAGDSIPHVANVHSPSNGHGQEGTEAGHSVPPVGGVYRLTHDNLLQHQLRYGDHKVGKEPRNRSDIAVDGKNRGEHAKKERWTLEQIKQLYV